MWQDAEWSPWWGYLAACLVLLLVQRYLKLVERLVSLLLSLRLVSVLSRLGPETVQFSLRKGSFSLQNVRLKPDFVDSLDLPFRCKGATIQRMEFQMPVLRYGASKAAILDISEIELEGITRRTPEYRKPLVAEEKRALAAAAQRQAKLSAIEALLWDERPTIVRSWRLRNFFKRHFAFHFARMLDVRLKDVSLHIVVDRGLKLGSDVAATPGRGAQDSDVIGSVVTYRIRSFTIRNAAAEGYGVLTTDVQLQGFSIDVHKPPLGSGAPPGTSTSILRRWNADLKLGWRLASGFFDRVTQRSGTPVVNVDIFAHALLFNFDAPAMKAVVSLHAHMLYYYRYYSYRMLRPQVSVDANPQAWWQHAGRAVRSERAEALGSESSRCTTITERRFYRRKYHDCYLRRRSLARWVLDAARGCPHATRDALLQLESQLGESEIGQFRWWAWARQKRKGQADVGKELGEKLEAVYRVMGARGKVRQKRSRPLRAQLSFSCPKVSVVLETGGDNRPTLFEVAMYDLHSTVLAGSQHSRQLQSGAGPISVDASIAAFAVTHTSAEHAAVVGPSSSAAADEGVDLLTPWLMRSPPEASRKEVAPNFMTMRCSQPALRAADPLQVQLSVAQIDMVYSQYALLRLLAFLNEGYPPPNLDPLMVRASVTLNEIVRERLVGPKRRHQVQKHQQSQVSVQANAGDIRLMVPCSRAAAAGRAAAFGQNTAPFDETATTVGESEPSFMVVILSGFSVSSQAEEQKSTPRPTRSSTLGRSGRFDRFTTDLETIIESAPPSARQANLSQKTQDTANELDTIAAPVSVFAQVNDVYTAASRSERQGWLRRRPGATFFERLQVRMGLEAFLAKPDGGPLEFRDCAQVIDPFIITTRVDHCLEPASISSYRRVLQVMLTTSTIRVELSKFVKQELHSLANYMHSNLTHQQVTTTISRHFAGKSVDGMADGKKAVEAANMGHHRTGLGSNVVFGDRRSTMRRIATATTELSTQQSADVGGTTEDGEEDVPEAHAEESHYGLVLALQIHIPEMGIDLVRSSSDESAGDDPDGPPATLFCVSLSDLQTTLAIDEDVRDMRFAVGSLGVVDHANDADVKHIIRPTPLIVDESCSSNRAVLRRTFQAWRKHVAQHSNLARQARDTMHHFLLNDNSQVSGHVMSCSRSLSVCVESSLLHVAVEVGTLRRALLYCCELAEATPEAEELGSSQPAVCKLSSGGETPDPKGKGGAKANATFAATETPLHSSLEASAQKSVSVQVYLHAVHLDVIVESQRLATVISSGLECSWNAAADVELFQQLLLRCTGFQVLDRLCASHLYREAMVCEKRDDGLEGTEALLQVAVVLQNSYHDPPTGLQENTDERPTPKKQPANSPTAVQRLAALSAGALTAQPQSSLKRHAHRRRRKAQPQRVIRVECDGLHIAFVSRFMYDCAHFGKEVVAMKNAVVGSSSSACSAVEPGYRTIMEVVVTNLRVDLPRHSWSPEFYSLSCSQAAVVYPATSVYIEQLKPDMTGPPQPRELNRASFQTMEDCDWWEHVPRLLTFETSRFPIPRRGTRADDSSLPPTPIHGADEHNEKFHHWQQGQDGGVVVQLEDPKLFWCLVQRSASSLAMRQVWDGGHLVVNYKPETHHAAVWCPWVRCVIGELQYELLLGVFWENAYEPCTFAAPEEPVFPYGRPLPPAPPQTNVFGVDKTKLPNWKVDISVQSVHGIAEKLPPSLGALGGGPDLGRVQMRDLHLAVGEWPDGSWDITLASKTLFISDTRSSVPLLIVQIGAAEEADTGGRVLSRLGTLNVGNLESPSGQWDKVTDAGTEGSGQFAAQPRFARNASFAWDTSPNAPESGTTYFTPQGRAASQDLDGVDTPVAIEEGFFLEYVMQAAAPATSDTPALAGPHVVEVVLKGAQLTYPLGTMRSFGHDIVEAYTHYIYPPWVSPYPQDLSPDQWMYANVITNDCHLFVPLPDDSVTRARTPWSQENGLNFTWRRLRLGRSWGGDGECTMRFNADELSAAGHVDGSLHGVGLISPFRAKAEMRTHYPKDQQERISVSLDVRSSSFEAQPSFGQMPLFHSMARLLLSSADLDAKLDKTEEFFKSVVFRPSTQHLNVEVDSLSIGLVDDRYGHHIKVLSGRLQDLGLKIGRDYPHQGVPADTRGTAKMAMEVLFLNSAVDATEPMMESWPFSISFRETNGHRIVTLLSDTRLNLIVTPAAFRSVGDLYSFVKQVRDLPENARRSLPSGLSRSIGKALAQSRQKMTTLYRITNQSGLKLSYWVEIASGDTHLLRPFQSSDLHVEPVEKSVIMPDSQQQVGARTICMQFEGNWTPVTDIIVDKVGKYAYTIGSPHDTSLTPVIMDVSLDIRTKVLTVHSPFRIENHTNHPLEFNVHLFVAPSARDARGSLLHNTAISTVPASPLQPGAQCYLPVPAVWGGLMYLHAVGWQIGKKDKIDLEGPKLKEKEGLYTCPPVNPGQKPFHCCLKVREEVIKVFSKDGVASSGLPEYVMCFQPPLIVHNVLPFPISVILVDATTQAEPSMFTIGVGGFVEVYQFDMARKIRMSIRMEEFHSLHSVNIHYPPTTYMDDSTRKSVIADLPGLRLAKQITLVRNSPLPSPAVVFGPQTNRLNLRLHNKMDSASRSREVVVSCPYWIVNKTNLILRIKDTTLNANQPVAAPPGLGGQAEPVLFSTSRGSMRVAVHHGAWSWSINLESLGLHYAFHVLGPPQAVSRGHKLTESAADSIMHFDCERIIAPRGYSPRKSRLVGRLGSMNRLDSMESVVELASPKPTEVTDPGHVLRKFSCATGGRVVEGEKSLVKRYEFAIETSVGPSIFHRTKVITILPRYVLANNSDEPLQYGQRGTTLVWQLSPGVRTPFHWDDAEGKFELCVRPANGKWNWSGAFQIGNVGDYGLRVYNTTTRQHLILPVEVSLNGASFLITVGKEAEQPPYRIENRCENVKVRFQQREIDRDHWESVEPGHSVDYAWEEPMMPHRLCVSLETEGVAYRDASEHDYNLDVIKAFPVVKLRRTNFRIVHKVANTVGRVMTTGINIAKSSPALQSQDQPELDARYVYVGVHADGPTRVLCFSETRDEYTRGTNEESVVLLTQKLKSLEERNREVDAQLRTIDEKQNIDMALVMGATTDRAGQHVKDQMKIPNRPSMRLGRERTLSTDLAAVGSLVSISRAPSLARGDSRPHSPREDGDSPTDDESTRGNPTLVRRSIAMIKKVAFPREASLGVPKDSLAAISEKEDEEGSRAGSLPLGALTEPGQLVLAALPPASSQGTREVEPVTAAAFHQRSLAAQRNLSRFGRSISASSPERSADVAGPSRASSFSDAMLQTGGGSPPSSASTSPNEIQADRQNSSSSSVVPDDEDARKGTILLANKLRLNHLSVDIPEEHVLDASQLPTSPYESAQPSSSGLGMATLTKLKRLSIIRQTSKPRTVGSASELEAKFGENGLGAGSLSFDRALTPTALAEKERTDEDGNPILGGEMVVKVVDAQGLVESWRKRDDKLRPNSPTESASGSPKAQSRTEQLKQRAMTARGDVYCILRCEGQVKRTALARGHHNPVWKEDIAFKSVQISSDLQVTVFGRARLGHDVFLGEVLIPLREVEGVTDGQPDLRRYILGRRNAKEKVSGEISLACSWRVTPLDVVTMKVKQQQFEVDHKEEILALLQERYNIADASLAALPASLTAETSLAIAPSHKSFRVMADEDPDIKRIVTYRGRLSVKVIEGRNITPNLELLHSFYTIDGYVQVTVNSEAGPTSLSTKAERGNTGPVWNKTLSFADVALGDAVVVSLYDHKKLSADVLLGQANLPVLKFRSCKPHYLWLPLKRRLGDKEVPVGELHLRVQWASDEAERPVEAIPSWALDVQLKGIGLSIIEATVLKFPREAMHALLEDIHIDFKLSTREQSGSFAIYSMQIDNQLLTSSRPVVLSHDAPPLQSMEEIPAVGHKHLKPPFLEIKWDMQKHNSSIIYFKSVSFILQDMDLVLEEEFLELMVHVYRSLPVGDIWQAQARDPQASAGSEEAEIQHNLQEILDASMIRSAAAAKRVGKKWYFENLDIQGIKCNLTLIPKSSHSEDLGLQRARLTTAFGIHFMDINNVSLRINALQMKNAFVTWRTLVSQIYRHLFFQALHEVHKILGQVDILGSPIVLGSSIFAGVSSFFKEPLKARSPGEFARGIGKGSLALIKFSAFGLLEASGQLTGGVSKGLALMTMDQEFVNRFRIRSVTVRQRLLQGVQAAGVGVYEGVLGVIREPISGWEDDGMRGVLVGVYLGGSGMILKPVSGLLEFISRSIGGVGEAIRAFGDEVTRVPKTRIRSPRQFMSTGLATGELYNVAWKQTMMARLRKGRFAEDEILDYLQNKDNKAVLFTNRHLIYINLKQSKVRWSFSLDNLSSVSTSGLLVLLHHELTMRTPLPWRAFLHVPVRKRVQCRTRDLHQSLLVKLNRAQLHRSTSQLPTPAAPPKLTHPETSVEADDLHIISAVPPEASAGAEEPRPKRMPALAKSLSRMVSGQKEGPPAAGASPPASQPNDLDKPGTGKREPQAELAGEESRVGARSAGDSLQARLRAARNEDKGRSGSAAGDAAARERCAACLQAVRLLVQAAGREGVPPETALQHLRSVSMLCKACAQGAEGSEAAAAIESISGLCDGASAASLQSSGGQLVRALGLLCSTAEEVFSRSLQ